MNTRAAFVAAPLLVLSYGVFRIVDGLDGSRGPGLAWTAGHLAFLAALALFIVIFREMWRMLGRNRIATTSLVVGLVGIACAAAQFAIDIVVGFMAADHDAMSPLFDQVQAVPGVSLAVYAAGPVLFYVAQLALVVQLAARRQVKLWTPVLVMLDFAIPILEKDLIPLGAVCMLVSFWPLARRQAQAGARPVLVHA
ncbi:hypothetical protein ACFYUV_45930 [Nonomuraea sp. NPDC003560]|uniref:hypothetical protein n=1 Tax=Nonomuraea sp. NPDC003560 TaxID=3364341 RepID=UPI00369D047A